MTQPMRQGGDQARLSEMTKTEARLKKLNSEVKHEYKGFQVKGVMPRLSNYDD